MPSANLFKGLLKNIASEKGFVGAGHGGFVGLTPYLSMVASILYMMAADGELSEQECSQLQSVVGGDDQILRRAVQYVETHSIDTFLSDVPNTLEGDDQFCMLMNVCDSIMADGEMAKEEMILFSRMLNALGQSRETFKPYFQTISIKNKRSVFGAFDDTAAKSALTPQIALAASVLYMMSSDGSMAAEEVGQLQVVIGQSQTLLKASLKYVKEIKFHQFIKLAAPLLNQPQRLCVLMNVCDSMLADGRIDVLEKDLFKRMLAEFGVSEANFNGHFKNLFLKNEKPQDIRKGGFQESRNKHDSERIKSKDGAQQHFDRTIEGQDPNLTAPPALTEQSELGTAITRTMQENISKLSGEMASEQDMIVMAENANEYEKEDGVSSKRHQADVTALADPEVKKITQGVDSATARAIIDTVEKAAGVGGSKAAQNGLVDSSPARKDIAGAAEIRSMRDAEGAADRRSIRDAEGASDTRSMKDAEGAGDRRSVKDAEGAADRRSMKDAEGAADRRSMKDADGAADVCSMKDADGAADVRSMNDADGAADVRSMKDAEGAADRRSMKDADGAADVRSMNDADGAADVRSMKDAEGAADVRRMTDAEGDADLRILDDSDSHDNGAMILARINYLQNWTNDLKTALDKHEDIHPHQLKQRGIVLDAIAFKPDYPVELANHAASRQRALRAQNSGLLSKADNIHQLGSESMSQSGYEELKAKVAVLTTALIIAQGFSSYGLNTAQNELMFHQMQITNAHASFQAASVQQTIYQVSADQLDLNIAKKDGYASEQLDLAAKNATDYRAKSDSIESSPQRNDGKKELKETVKRNEAFSSIQSLKLRWFGVANGLLMFGFFLTFFGLFFKSRLAMTGSTAVSLLGTLVTINGFYLFV
jgi:uncharacterized tellurite resistance protein B-like protein